MMRGDKRNVCLIKHGFLFHFNVSLKILPLVLLQKSYKSSKLKSTSCEPFAIFTFETMNFFYKLDLGPAKTHI